MSRQPTHTRIIVDPNLVPRFFGLLHKGFMVKAETDTSVQSFLCNRVGIRPEYLEERIQTIFLDGKPLDDPSKARIRAGTTIALSAAMPGLAGATLRKGGFFATMRSQISHREKHAEGVPEDVFVTLKLFNLLLRELGPDLLRTGIWIETGAFVDFIQKHGKDVLPKTKEITLDGRIVEADAIADVKKTGENIFLQVEAAG